MLRDLCPRRSASGHLFATTGCLTDYWHSSVMGALTDSRSRLPRFCGLRGSSSHHSLRRRRDAYDAVRILAEHHVDLLFTDIVMPGMDGVQLARQAKVMQPAIKVLFTTGYAQRAAERQAMRLGRVLFKPLRHAELIREVEMLLGTV